MPSLQRAAWLVGIVAGASAACSDSSEPTAVDVRLQNGSGVAYDQATLFTLDGPRTYTNVEPGVTTPYITVTAAYSFATTEVVVGNDTLRLQVIDYVGEEPLPAGRYTYVLTVSELGTAAPILTQVLRQDE